MEAPKTLRKPSNWQDFELLCKKLWGEIWSCPEIKKNGRLGQDQYGVDVYGIPFGENAYYGIQCKGKDEYTDKQFTEIEIKREAEKALLFKPALKKLYFATTAVKDTKIEQVVRQVNLDNIRMGVFEVHIFSWEDIVDLITENKHTYDWYVKSQNYKTLKSVSVTFDNNEKELTLNPKFKQTITHYYKEDYHDEGFYETSPKSSKTIDYDTIQLNRAIGSVGSIMYSATKLNLSYVKFFLKIHNIGLSPIEEYKIFLEFGGDIQDIANTNKIHYGLAGMRGAHYVPPDVELFPDDMTGKIIPRKSILVGDDIFSSDDIFLKPSADSIIVKIKWKLVSTDFKDAGELLLRCEPNIEITKYEREVKEVNRVGVREGEIEDYLINDE